MIILAGQSGKFDDRSPGKGIPSGAADETWKPPGIPVRLHDGTLIAHANQELEDRLVTDGVAAVLRREPRRYLRLRQGICVPRTAKGWDLMEFLRRWHGNKRAAAYVRHKDRQSETLRYQPPRAR